MISYSKLDKEVFEEFSNRKDSIEIISNKIKDIIQNSESNTAILKVENNEITSMDSVKEGQILFKWHKVR